MKIHFLGICGTFMGSLALLAKQLGHQVVGSDEHVYPPMSEQLTQQGITLYPGYQVHDFDDDTDLIVVGNAMKRGNAMVEHLLNHKLAYRSGPQWLSETILTQRQVIAVAGTHGKTTTSSMIAWILQYAGLQAGYLIGGVPGNFAVSARLGDDDYFVIEADEYDSAFFDKRSKFIHYQPQYAVLNNLEFDHADIFRDLQDIKRQFNHLLRIIPSNGHVFVNAQDTHLQDVIATGCWSHLHYFLNDSATVQATAITTDKSQFNLHAENKQHKVSWNLIGDHNLANALAAANVAYHIGIDVTTIAQALSQFKNTKRRMELKANLGKVQIYDDFGHHPTAIAHTLAGLRAKVGSARILCVIEFGSYTMRHGHHSSQDIVAALQDADHIYAIIGGESNWNLAALFQQQQFAAYCAANVTELVTAIQQDVHAEDVIIIFSNTGFAGFHAMLLQQLKQKQELSHGIP